MIREGDVWRVISMPTVSESLNGFQGDVKEIENF
jgi:hypothetical protein